METEEGRAAVGEMLARVAAKLPSRETKRKCGLCSSCCTLLRVDALEKPAGTPCPNLRRGGKCGIYETRPGICRGYMCAWLVGMAPREDRPDRVGYVTSFAYDPEHRLPLVCFSAGQYADPLRLVQAAGWWAWDQRTAVQVQFSPELPDEKTSPILRGDLPGPVLDAQLATLYQALLLELPERREGRGAAGWYERGAIHLRRVLQAERPLPMLPGRE
jgi:Fe-S-cluster containining protein